MKNRWVKLGLAVVLCLSVPPARSQQTNTVKTPFKDDPAAHRLYRDMIEAMRKATTLSWTSDYQWESQGRVFSHGTYRIWLKKPNYARLEVTPAGAKGPSGILVGDGDYFWTYWPAGKPRYGFEFNGKYAEEYKKYGSTFYMKKPTPVGKHSIGHEIGNLASLAPTIIDPSTFHGYTDSLQPYVDGVQSLGTDTIGGEVCDGIEVSIMKHQRSWYLWLAKGDRLPRKLKEVVRVGHDMTLEGSWSEVVVNADISNDRFAWSAPADWKEWKMPDIEEGLLKPGTTAPDFELSALNGGKLKLSGFRGQIVWLNKWRCG